MTGTPTPTLDPRAAPASVRALLDRVRPVIDAELERRLAVPARDPGRLVEAMRYAATGPGKRLRPALVIAACEACGGAIGDALPAAAALELLHAYTLVHDDLPAMDDDDERRGRPTVHVAFGEAIAILAGDGLLTMAFGCLAELGPGAAAAVATLAGRAGAGELLAGQALDLELIGPTDAERARLRADARAARRPVGPTDAERARLRADARAARRPVGRGGAPSELATVEDLHARKTGALFAAAAELGAIAAGAGADTRERLGRYGLAFGIAFQHADDRDDGDLPEHAAAAAGRIAALADEAVAIARGLGVDGPLVDLAAWIGSRA